MAGMPGTRPSFFAVIITAWLAAIAMPLHAAEPVSLEDLLERVEQGMADDAETNARRLDKFRRERDQQAEALEALRSQVAAAEARSDALNARFEENEVQVLELEQRLETRLGELRELFGVLQQSAGDTRGAFENSITQVQYPDRAKFLTRLAEQLGETSRLASIEDIEMLWYEIQREITTSARVEEFEAVIVDATGRRVRREVVRVGLFNLVSKGNYLEFEPETGTVTELDPGASVRREDSGLLETLLWPVERAFGLLDKVVDSPLDRYRGLADALQAGDTTEPLPFAVDPTRGQILRAELDRPDLSERFRQGGVIGYIIGSLGVVALLVALLRLAILTTTGIRVAAQKRRIETPSRGNPLGRVLLVQRDSPTSDLETLEMRLTETIMRESARLDRGQVLLKVIATVAPLLGLLGTVTGMIVTFQAITLFGTGDPKQMAGGISQALVTTVQGLAVAIPTLLLYTLVSSRARVIRQVLEEQAAGKLADQVETNLLAGASANE